MARLRALLQRLPEEQRSVLLLICVEGQSYAQAAETLALPIGTVTSRLARARLSLKDWMGRDDSEDVPSASQRDRHQSGS
jgi:RNA polymerase sigma-70 factor, ECF subfamily